MPSSYLFCLNNEGRVNLLSTNSAAWREMKYVGLDFKRVSAVPHFLWGVGGDRQIYVHVYGLDVPIRVKEESYENERWYPIEGFSSRLLPTDRYHFSSADGTVDRTRNNIKLPSMAWQWETEWQLETSFNAKPLDHDAWTYAVDFPAQFNDKKDWKSCVRRRKWVRYRRYSAMNSWCAVSPLYKDPTQEPFIDVAIGGMNLPGAEPGTLAVWAVTAHGRVMFRTGVSSVWPEGQRWTHIPTPSTYEVSQIAVGATGLVWASMWNGKIIVRSGITRDNPSGDLWLDVRPPGDGLSVQQISVGSNSVWALTADGKVWFRKGVNGEGAGVSEEMAIGSRWIEQAGDMTVISVAFNDQVFAIGREDRCLYFRGGVNVNNLTGKTWRLLHVPMQLSRASSNASLAHFSKFPNDKKHRSLSYLNKHQSFEPCVLADGTWDETSHSAPEAVLMAKTSNSSSYDKHSNHSLSSQHSTNIDTNIVEFGGKLFETSTKGPKAFNAIKSAGSVVATEACPEFDVWRDESRSCGDSAIFGDNESLQLFWTEYDAMWTWITASACMVDANFLPPWFISNNTEVDLTQSWRVDILNQLHDRYTNQCASLDLSEYELAVDITSWIKRCSAKYLLTNAQEIVIFEDCLLELEWISGRGKQLVVSATLTVLNVDTVTIIFQIALQDVTCVRCCSEPGSARLAVHIPTVQSQPVIIHFGSDSDLEDWLANLSVIVSQMNRSEGSVHDQGCPSKSSIWATTGLGEVFVYDPRPAIEAQTRGDLYSIELQLTNDCGKQSAQLANGFRDGDTLTISGCVDEFAERFSINLECDPSKDGITDVALHYDARFDENCIVKNSQRHNEWDEFEERESIAMLEPGLEFTMQIFCIAEGFRIFCHGKEVSYYKHRMAAESIAALVIRGPVKIFTVTYRSRSLIIDAKSMYWRQIGGHLRQVESCENGTTWGIGFDNTVWVYTGGWGGSFLQGLETSQFGVNQIVDHQNYYVYENQRWNPVGGYSATGLPTDRHMWSDVTGKHKRTRDHAKLLSKHWQWVCDWQIDFNCPGGVDREGWQYAVDFPANFHAKKHFSDMVRRRRWFRKCQLTTTGPWQELSNTQIQHLSLNCESAESSATSVWAISTCGDALFRTDVTLSNKSGNGWQHMACDQPLTSISCGPMNRVWALAKNGLVYWRLGSGDDQASAWNSIEAPGSAPLKQISSGLNCVWVVDCKGKLSVRTHVTVHFPEGTKWQTIVNHDPDLCDGFRQVAATVCKDQVWAITQSGMLCRRTGISTDNPAGSGWMFAINCNWHHLSVSNCNQR